MGLVPGERLDVVASAVEVARVGVHVAGYPMLGDFPPLGDQVGLVAGQAVRDAFSESLVHQQQRAAPMLGRQCIMGHAQFERWASVAHDPVSVGVSGSSRRVGEDRGAGVAIEDLPGSGARLQSSARDRVEGPWVAIAFPVAPECQSDTGGQRLARDHIGVVGLEQSVIAPGHSEGRIGVAELAGHDVIAQDDPIQSPQCG